VFAQRVGHRLVHEGTEFPVVCVTPSLGMFQRHLQFTRQAVRGRCHGDGCAVTANGVVAPVLAFVQPAPHQQGHQVVRVERLRTQQGRFLRSIVATLLVHQRERDPALRVACVGAGNLLEEVACAVERAALQGLLGLRFQRRQVVRQAGDVGIGRWVHGDKEMKRAPRHGPGARWVINSASGARGPAVDQNDAVRFKEMRRPRASYITG
jgi:hypothetical protein